MIDTTCQVPVPSADAWSLDLVTLEGARFVILRSDKTDARQRLAEHLTWLGRTDNDTESLRLLRGIEAEQWR